MRPEPVPSRDTRRVGISPLFSSLAKALPLTLVASLVAAGFGSNPKKPEPYALLAGTVWAVDNRPVPGLKVKIHRVDNTKTRWELVTNSRGEFTQRLPAVTADYIIRVEPKGRKGQVVERKVHFAGDERQNIGLHLTE